MVLFALISTIFLLSCLYYTFLKIKMRRLPPGPFQFPFIGNIPQLVSASPEPHIAMHQIGKKYGDIWTVRVGQMQSVMLASYETIRDVYFEDGANGREIVGLVEARCKFKKQGVLFAEGSDWIILRKFTLKALQDFGLLGKRETMERIVHSELDIFQNHLSNLIKKDAGKVYFDDIFLLVSSNIMWNFITGSRKEYNDEEFNYILRLFNEDLKETTIAGSISLAFPWLANTFPKVTGYAKTVAAADKFFDFVQNAVIERRATKEFLTKPNGFIDYCLAEMERTQSDPSSIFTEEQCVMMCLDFTQAGGDATAQTFKFTCLLLAEHLNVQRKIQNEIDMIMGNKKPQLQCRDRMLYTQATILEIFRWASTRVNYFPHQSTSPVKYRNFLFPTGTVFMADIYTVHRDPTFWGDPFNFRPERFMSNDENEIMKDKAERVIPFGFGKRKCPVYKLTEEIVFLMMTSILQRFCIHLDPKYPKPNMNPVAGLLLCPVSFHAIVKERT